MKNKVAIILLYCACNIFLFTKCEKEVHLGFNFKPNTNINCILNPDSVLRLRLTSTDDISHSGSYLPISGATVEITADRAKFALADLKDGNYFNPGNPSPGSLCTLSVKLPDGREFSSRTIIPSKPETGVLFLKDNYSYSITITDNPGEKNFYWIFAQEGDYHFEYMKPPVIYYKNNLDIFTNSTIGDKFNRSEESNLFPGFTFIHKLCLRISDELMNGKTVNFKVKISDRDNRVERIQIVSLDEYLDRYLKTSILQTDQKAAGDNPAFLIPISMFSNIEHGTGIFGSCTIASYETEF